jgi:L-fuconolactonase
MIDSHHHLWNYSPAEYGWIPPGSPLAQDQLLAELESATAAAGVEGTVVVQARQILEESDWLLGLADQSRIIRGVVGWVPLIAPDVAAPLARLAAHAKLKGVRHVLQDEPDSYFLRDDFHRGLSQLPGLGLHYDLLILQRQLPVALELVDRQPELGIIIDHIAKPEIRKGRIDPAWQAGMAALARRDQVLGVKISGMVTEVLDPEIDEATLRAYFEETLALFGPQRLLFGSDWPVCLLRIDSYSSWAALVRGFVAGLSADERQAILHGNAARIYTL